MYDVDWDEVSAEKINSTGEYRECRRWEGDTTDLTSTIRSEFNLVCDRD